MLIAKNGLSFNIVDKQCIEAYTAFLLISAAKKVGVLASMHSSMAVHIPLPYTHVTLVGEKAELGT